MNSIPTDQYGLPEFGIELDASLNAYGWLHVKNSEGWLPLIDLKPFKIWSSPDAREAEGKIPIEEELLALRAERIAAANEFANLAARYRALRDVVMHYAGQKTVHTVGNGVYEYRACCGVAIDLNHTAQCKAIAALNYKPEAE